MVNRFIGIITLLSLLVAQQAAAVEILRGPFETGPVGDITAPIRISAQGPVLSAIPPVDTEIGLPIVPATVRPNELPSGSRLSTQTPKHREIAGGRSGYSNADARPTRKSRHVGGRANGRASPSAPEEAIASPTTDQPQGGPTETVNIGDSLSHIFDGRPIVAYLVRAGHDPVAVSLDRLQSVAADSGFSDDFNSHSGHARLIHRDGLMPPSDLAEAALGKQLRGIGLNVTAARTRTEFIPADAQPEPEYSETEGSSDATWWRGRLKTVLRVGVAAGTVVSYYAHFGIGDVVAPLMLAGIVSNVDRIAFEFAYTVRMLRAAFRDSKGLTWNEIGGGIVGKVLPAVAKVGFLATTYQSHPIAFALSVVLSLSIETFHGVGVNVWNTFQDKIGRHRGIVYQNLFNLIYGQLIIGSYRTIAYFSLGNIAPYWSFEYLHDVVIMTVVGAFFGTLGHRALNSMYAKGRVPRWGRASIQQARDFCMMALGPFLGSGDMFMTWLLFSLSQALDLTLFIINQTLETRPIIYFAEEAVAESNTFRKFYIDKALPFKEAMYGLKESDLARPLVSLIRRLRRKLSQ